MGVWLLPAARRKGIGRELALMALEFARDGRLRQGCAASCPPATSRRSPSSARSARWPRSSAGGMQYELPL